MNGDLKLLVEWSSPWEEFKSAIRPAFGRSPDPLAGEAHTGLFPYRGMLGSWVAEALLLVSFLFLSRQLESMRSYQPPPPAKYDVIYYSGNELPRTADVGGARSGRSGRSGGREAHHPTQTIRVARGESLREKVVDAPRLNLPHSDAAVANLLAYKPVPGPPPAEGMKSSLRIPVLPQTQAIAPAPEFQADQMQAAPTLNASVIPPAPSPQNIAPLRIPGSHPVQVVPPPVSAPEQVTSANPRLVLPALRVVAPPPTQVTRELATAGPGFSSGELQKQVVPPPVQMGDASAAPRATAGLGNGAIVPPPVQLGSGSVAHQPVSGLGGGMAVVPPPPTVGAGSSLTGRGRGNRGGGMGAPGEMGDVAAPPSGGGNAAGNGVVLSHQPGPKVGVPGGGGAGSLAMSPEGGANPGLGGSGGGGGIGRGRGPGSGLAGPGPGAGREGSGRGSDPNARSGISPFPGAGGTSNGTGSPAIGGVSVSGGTDKVVNLPSFSQGGSQPTDPSRSLASPDKRSSITVVATSRSGGALRLYGALKGDKVYTIYIDTTLGTAVMQFADSTSAQHPYAEDLTAPQPLRTGLPGGVRRSRLVIACVLDQAGVLRDPQVLESTGREMAAKVLAALPGWKFRPALRRDQPIEVTAILGFDIDTSDP